MTDPDLTPELKPCPFCGETDISLNDATRILGTWNIIHRCKVVGPIKIESYDKERVTAAWNRRADLCTPADERVQALAGAHDALLDACQQTHKDGGKELARLVFQHCAALRDMEKD